jgi:uncharacterized membrane protein
VGWPLLRQALQLISLSETGMRLSSRLAWPLILLLAGFGISVSVQHGEPLSRGHAIVIVLAVVTLFVAFLVNTWRRTRNTGAVKSRLGIIIFVIAALFVAVIGAVTLLRLVLR